MKHIEEFLQRFSSISFHQEEIINNYASDYTEDLHFKPDVVVKPTSVDDVSKVLTFCNEHKIFVTPRGAGTGLSGGSLPVKGGISLSLEKLNRIIEIDTKNFQATVESGVINETFQQEVAKYGLFYPPDPASKGSCFLGGNIAHSSGGPRALKYGTTKDYVLNLEVVLPNGEIIWTGANTLKNSTGYNLTQLMIGSEGTLGVVTKIVFKLLPKPNAHCLLLASFSSIHQACECVPAIFLGGISLSALELMEKSAVEYVLKYGKDFSFPQHPDSEAYLLIELDGGSQEDVFSQSEKLYGLLEKYEVLDVHLAETSDEMGRLWRVRRQIGEKVKQHSIYKEEDTVVPRASFPVLMDGVKKIGEKYGFESVCYGHAGDGNLHVNILKGNMSDRDWKGEHLKDGIREIFRLCKKLGGTISGEHGIGYVQKPYLEEVLTDTHIKLMKGIKSIFDPNGIMNPDKIWE